MELRGSSAARRGASLALGGLLLACLAAYFWTDMSWTDDQDEITLHVNTYEQILTVKAGELILWQAPVSTSYYGLGEEEGSHRTPRGKHRIVEKIGDGEPLYAVFKHRQPTGEIWDTAASEEEREEEGDLILTRILWLAGQEAHNRNSQERYIYFHGTNHEDAIGTPSSIGCIRLKNADMLRLFDEYTSVNTPVVIE
ncbi:MAG: L,D-transpeptidase [Verrucomicrobiota bacterium]